MTRNEYMRFMDWLSDKNRKPANVAFTAGELRDAATALEDSGELKAADDADFLRAENARLHAALEHCTQEAGRDSCAGYALRLERVRKAIQEHTFGDVNKRLMAAMEE